MFILNFVIRGKVTSLPRVIKYVKEVNLLSTNFSAKHTPSATLNITFWNGAKIKIKQNKAWNVLEISSLGYLAIA